MDERPILSKAGWKRILIGPIVIALIQWLLGLATVPHVLFRCGAPVHPPSQHLMG